MILFIAMERSIVFALSLFFYVLGRLWLSKNLSMRMCSRSSHGISVDLRKSLSKERSFSFCPSGLGSLPLFLEVPSIFLSSVKDREEGFVGQHFINQCSQNLGANLKLFELRNTKLKRVILDSAR